MATAKRKKTEELPMDLPRTSPGSRHVREFRLRLPPDLSEQIEKEAITTGLPQNRIIINMLARVVQADETVSIARSARHFEEMLAKYGSQINSVILGKELLKAVDDILDAQPNELQARVERLRIVRRGMRELERTVRR